MYYNTTDTKQQTTGRNRTAELAITSDILKKIEAEFRMT